MKTMKRVMCLMALLVVMLMVWKNERKAAEK